MIPPGIRWVTRHDGTADVLRQTFPDELVTRLGGDEFLVTI